MIKSIKILVIITQKTLKEIYIILEYIQKEFTIQYNN